MKRSRPGKWVNARGQKASASRMPPDLKHCQCCPNVLNWSPFAFGPKPEPRECGKRPTYVVVENKASGEDQKIGSMSFCDDCLELYKKHMPPTFGKVYPINEQA